MTDPVRRLGIAATGAAADGHRANGIGSVRRRIAPTATEWALLSGLIVAAPPLGLVAVVTFGVNEAVGLVVALSGGAAIIALRAHRRHSSQVREALPIALDALARDLRTGASFASAIARQAVESGPLATDFRRVHAAIERGQAVAEACRALVGAGSDDDRQTAAGVLAMVSDGGRGSARALEAAASAARQQHLVRGEVRSLVAQAESSVRVLAGLPGAFVGLGIVSGQAGATALFSTATGRWCLALGLALNACGLVWMRALVRSVQP